VGKSSVKEKGQEEAVRQLLGGAGALRTLTQMTPQNQRRTKIKDKPKNGS